MMGDKYMSNGERLGIFGRSGSGKSSLMNEILLSQNRVILFDFLNTRRPFAKKNGFKECTTLKDMKHAFIKGYGKGFRIWYRPPIKNQVKALHELSDWLFSVSSMRSDLGFDLPMITLAVDEMSNCYPVTRLPDNLQGFTHLCKAGRHFNINIVGATQRPAQVSTEFRGQLDRIALLSLNVPADFEAVRKLGGPEAEKMVREMPKYNYVLLDNGQLTHGQTRKDL
jgi:energy-coupling factor transporter ATP-binding protein EcfA2